MLFGCELLHQSSFRLRCWLVLFVATRILLNPCSVNAADVEFEVLVSDNQEDGLAPASIFQILEGPAAIDNAGNVYFESRNEVPADPATITTNVWRVNPDSTRTRLLSSAQSAPGIITGNDPATLEFLEFTDFSSPSVDAAVTEDGRIFFASSRFPSTGNELFLLDADGSLRNIARSPNSEPGNNETVNDGLVYADGRGNSIQGFATDGGFRVLRANSSGAIAYQGQVVLSQVVANADPGLSTRGIFTGTTRENTRAVAYIGTAATGTSSTWTSLELLGLSADGSVYFSGDLADGTEGIWQDRFGVVSLVARSGDQAPGFSDGRTLAGVGGGFDAREVSVNSNGEIAFLGLITDGIDTDADELVLWRGTPGNLEPVTLGNGSGSSDVQLNAPGGLVTARFNVRDNRFESLLLADNGDVIFSGEYRDVAGSTAPINAALRLASGSDQLAALQTGGNAFSISAINDSGQAIFQSGTSFRTLYAYDPVAGVSEVFRPNQVTDFGTVTNFEVITTSNGGASGRATSFNDAGQIAVAVFTSGGTNGIDHIVRADVSFNEIIDNAFRFSGTCGSGDWHADCAGTNWVDSDEQPQSRNPGDLGDENVIIESAEVSISDRAVTLASLSVDTLSSLTVQQDLTVSGSANIANLILQATFTAQGATNLIDPDIAGDIQTPLVAPFVINGTNGTWSAGSITGPSATVIDGDALLTVVDEVALGNRLEINGGLEVVDGGNLELSVNSSVLNEGTLVLNGGASVTNFDTDISSTFNNNGQINKRGEGGAIITSDFTQGSTGGVVVNEGELTIREGEMHLAGVLQSNDGASLLIEATANDAHTIASTLFSGSGRTTIRNGAFEVVDNTTLTVVDGTLTLDGVEFGRANGGQLRVLDPGPNSISVLEKNGPGVTALQGFDLDVDNAFLQVSQGDLLIDGDAILDGAEISVESGALFSLGQSGTTTVRGEGGINNSGGMFTSRNTLDIETTSEFYLNGGVNQLSADVDVHGSLDIRDAKVDLNDSAALSIYAGGEVNFIGDTEIIAEDPLEEEIDPLVVNSGLIRKSGSGTTKLRASLESDGTVSVAEGVLDLELPASLSNLVTIAKGAELRVADLGSSEFDNLDVSGEGLWTISGGTHEVLNETVIALGTSDVNALAVSGLVLDDVLSFGQGGRNLTIGREDSAVVSRLVKRGFEQTFVGVDALLNTVVESSNALLKFGDVDLFNTSLITRDIGIIRADEVFVEGNVSVDGTGNVLWEEGNFVNDSSLIVFSDFEANTLRGGNRISIRAINLGVTEGVSSRLLGRDFRIGDGARVKIADSLVNLDISITDQVDVVEDTCGVVCLASIESKTPSVIRETSLLGSDSVEEGELGSIVFGDLFNQVTLANTRLSVGDGGLVRFENDAALTDESTIDNEVGGIIEFVDGVLLTSVGPYTSFYNAGQVRTVGDVKIFLDNFSVDNTSDFLARPAGPQGFSDVEIRSRSILTTPVPLLESRGSIWGSWDIEDVVVSIFDDNDNPVSLAEARALRFGQSIRLAGSAEFAGLSRDIKNTIFNGRLLLESIVLRDGSPVIVQGTQPFIGNGGALQLIDTDLHLDQVTISGQGIFQSNATVVGDVASSGWLIIGSSPGRLTIDGDLDLAAGGRIFYELGEGQPGEGYDQLVVNGTATFDADAILDISLLEVGGEIYLPENGSQFELLVATDLVSTGPLEDLIQFSNAPNGFRFSLDEQVDENGFRFLLSTFLGSDLASIGLVGQDQVVAQALDAISLQGNDDALVDIALQIDALPTMLAKQQAVASLPNNFTTALYDIGRLSERNRRSGIARLIRVGTRNSGPLPSTPQQGFSGNRLSDRGDWIRLASHLTHNTPTRRFSDSVTGMLDVQYNNSSFDATRLGGDDVDVDGATLSAGVAVQDGVLHWGVLAQVGDYRADPSSGGSMDIEDWSVTGYVGFALANRNHQFTLSYAYGEYDADYDRQFAALGLSQAFQGETQAEYASAALRYGWHMPSVSGGPVVEISHYRAVVEDLTEQGLAGALHIEGDSYGHTAASVGWLADLAGLTDTNDWQVNLGLYYQHLINQDYNDLDASFVGAPINQFTIAQSSRESGALQAEMNVRWESSEDLDWFLNLGYTHARDMQHGYVSGGVNYRF